MFSSAGDLESTLRDVEPILHGNGNFQFTHPPFREVLAARQFADEINSGRLSVKDVYYGIMIRRHYSCDLIKSHLRPVIHDMVEILSEKKALELVELISEFTVESSERWPWKFRSYHVGKIDEVVEDLVICAEFIGKHRWGDAEGHKCAKEILDLLGKIYDECAPKWSSDERTPFYSRYVRASHALHQAKSSYANKLLNARLYAMVTSGVLLISSPDRIREFSRSTVRNLGVDGTLEALLEGSCMFTDSDQEYAQKYLIALFEVIREGDFEKEHIKQFNEELAKSQSDVNFMKTYRSVLNEFARSLKISGIDLYVILEKKGAQFFDSGMYKPK